MIIQTTRKRFPFVKVPKSSSRKEWQVQAINATPSGVQWSGRVIVMAHMGRPGLSAAQKADLRQRWKQGAVIERDRPGPRQARRLDSWRAVRERRIHSSRSHAVALGTDTGGARRDFAWPGHGALDPADRGHARSRTVDRQPGNPPPWWSPRLSRRGGRHAAWAHTRRPKSCRLATSPLLQQIVASKLALEWSPAQVAGWLKLEFPDQDTMRVSHETIYRSLFIQARGVLKKELIGHLRSRRRMRRAQCASTAG